MTLRVYLGGFKFSHRQEPPVPTPEELQQRFGAIQDIELHSNYVHFSLPPTEDPEGTFKKIKAKYNGSVWKGSKVRLELAKAKEEVNVANNDLKEKRKKVRRLVRHCGDMQVVEDVSGKVRKGWVRSKGGRHVMQEVKVRKPDGKVKTVDVNTLFKKNIITSFNENPSEMDVQSIWSAHGFDMTPVSVIKIESKVEEKKEKIEEEKETKEDVKLENRDNGEPKTKKKLVKEDTKLENESKDQIPESKPEKTANVCKWSEVANANQIVSFSLFPSPEPIPEHNEAITKNKNVIHEEQQQEALIQPQSITEPSFSLEFALNIPDDVTSVIDNFVNHKTDINQWKRHVRPLLRKDIKQQRKQHLRTLRKSRRIDK